MTPARSAGVLHVDFRTGLTQVYLTPSKIHRCQQLDAQFVFDLLLEGVHQGIVEDCHLMFGTLHHVTSGENRPFRKERGQFLRRGDRHFQIAGGNGLKLGSLREQGAVPVRFEGRELGHGRTEYVGHRDCPLVSFRIHSGQPQLNLVLGNCASRANCKRCGCHKDGAARDGKCHFYPP